MNGLLAVDVPDLVSTIVPVAPNFKNVTAGTKVGVKVVSCEKPISAELAEADAMIAEVAGEGCYFLGMSSTTR